MEKLEIKILAYLLATVLLLGGGAYAGYHFTDNYWSAKYTSKINELKADSATKLAAATAAKTAAENTQKADAAKAEKDYEARITTLNGTIAQLRAEHVQLHDPGKRQTRRYPARPAASGSTSSSVVSSGSGSALSSGATDFLLGFAQRADTVRAALLQCQADDTSVRRAVDDYNQALKKISNTK